METVIRIAAVIIQNKKLLLVKGKGCNDLWTPGGKIKANENDRQCLERELGEELGVELLDARHFGDYSGPAPYHADRISINKMYICTTNGEPKPNNEIEKFVWFSKNDFENKTYSLVPLDENEIIPALIQANIF